MYRVRVCRVKNVDGVDLKARVDALKVACASKLRVCPQKKEADPTRNEGATRLLLS